MGQIKTLDQILEALLCDQYDVPLDGDYPMAAIAAVADGLEVVAKAYWLRADPVHLRLQRDCFSLDEAVPLPLLSVHAEQMLESLNRHFALELNVASGEPDISFLLVLLVHGICVANSIQGLPLLCLAWLLAKIAISSYPKEKAQCS